MIILTVVITIIMVVGVALGLNGFGSTNGEPLALVIPITVALILSLLLHYVFT